MRGPLGGAFTVHGSLVFQGERRVIGLWGQGRTSVGLTCQTQVGVELPNQGGEDSLQSLTQFR